MKAFAFRLEKVLRWREAKVELEQFKLSRLVAECAEWDRILARFEDTRCEAEKGVLASSSVGGGELEALARFKDRLMQQKHTALVRREECERKMEQQRGCVLAARREFRLLDRLRQVRRAEWEMLINRDFEALATENYLARWNR
jgi:flagellar export protein FliJ